MEGTVDYGRNRGRVDPDCTATLVALMVMQYIPGGDIMPITEANIYFNVSGYPINSTSIHPGDGRPIIEYVKESYNVSFPVSGGPHADCGYDMWEVDISCPYCGNHFKTCRRTDINAPRITCHKCRNNFDVYNDMIREELAKQNGENADPSIVEVIKDGIITV